MSVTVLPPKPMGRKRKEVDTSTYTGRFAVRLVYLRKKANLTVDELAEKSGIPQRTLYSWESDSKVPGIDQLPLLAKALGVKTATLLPKDE